MNQMNQQPQSALRAKIVESVRDYCTEHFMRPYIWVDVDDACIVPYEFVTDGMIVLDIDDEAIREFEVTNEILTFQARFGDTVDPLTVVVPLNRIVHAAPAEAPEEGASFMSKPTKPELRASILGEEKPKEATPAPRRPMRIK